MRHQMTKIVASGKVRVVVSLSVVVVLVATALILTPLAHAAWGLDGAFGSGGIVTTSFGDQSGLNSAALQADGKIVAGGYAVSGGQFNWALVRYNQDGSIDTGFGSGGKVIQDFGYNNLISGVGIQTDGKIVAAGTYGSIATQWTDARYNSDGTLDTSFGINGIAYITGFPHTGPLNLLSMTIQTDGKILTVGYNSGPGLDNNITVVRQNTDGSLDSSFGSGGIVQTKYPGSLNDNTRTIAVQPDGKILVAGDYAYGGAGQPILVRFNADGSLDNSFGNGGFVVESIGTFSGTSTVALQSDGKILVTGGDWAVTFPNPPLETYIIRYNSDGTRDATFGVNGLVVNPFNSGFDQGQSLVIDPSGKVFLGGLLGTQANPNFMVARFNTDGSLDTAFGSGGTIVTNTGASSGLTKILLSGSKLLGFGSIRGATCNWAITRYADVAPTRQLTTLAPAQVWIGLKNSDDVGVKFDLLAQAYADTTLISSGELDSVAAGSSGFNNAKLDTIPFQTFPPVSVPAGTQLRLVLSVRNACVGSGHNSGTARLWFNDSAASSQFGATIDSVATSYYLLTGQTLGTAPGTGPKQTADVQSGAKCSAFKPFGTWTVTP